MKPNPRILAERARLQQRLEDHKQLIHQDIHALKESVKPLAIAKNVISEASESFRDNSFATQGVRLALTMIPRRMRHPLVGIAAQIAVPMLLRNLPKVVNFIRNNKKETTPKTSLGEKVGNLLRRLRNS